MRLVDIVNVSVTDQPTDRRTHPYTGALAEIQMINFNVYLRLSSIHSLIVTIF